MGPSSILSSVTRAKCSKSVLYVGCMCPSVVMGSTTVGMGVGRVGPGPAGCGTLLLAVAVGPLVGGADPRH